MTRDVQWLAGLYEGEGTLSHDAKRDVWRLAIAMTDLDVIEAARDVAGVGRVYAKRLVPGHKQVWTWTVQGREKIAALVHELLPFMGNRRAFKMREFLEWNEPRDVEVQCHPREPGTVCRICANESSKRWRANQQPTDESRAAAARRQREYRARMVYSTSEIA